MKENEKMLDYIKTLLKEFNSILLLLILSIALTYLVHPIFTMLFIVALSIVAYKIIKVNNFVAKIEEVLKEDVKISSQEEDLVKCHKELIKVVNHDIPKETQPEVLEDKEESQEEIQEEVIEEVSKEEVIEEILEEILEEVNYVHNFDYVEETEFKTQIEEEVLVEKEVEKVSQEIQDNKIDAKDDDLKNSISAQKTVKEDIDIKKCIRKLPKGRKASEKAKALALSYGYELKEGETFVAQKNKG